MHIIQRGCGAKKSAPQWVFNDAKLGWVILRYVEGATLHGRQVDCTGKQADRLARTRAGLAKVALGCAYRFWRLGQTANDASLELGIAPRRVRYICGRLRLVAGWLGYGTEPVAWPPTPRALTKARQRAIRQAWWAQRKAAGLGATEKHKIANAAKWSHIPNFTGRPCRKQQHGSCHVKACTCPCHRGVQMPCRKPGRPRGTPQNAETRAKLRAAMVGRQITWGAKISAAKRRFVSASAPTGQA